MAKSKSFIPEEAVKAYNELNTALERNNAKLEEHFKTLSKVAGELSKASVSTKELASVINSYKKASGDVNKVYDENNRLLKEKERLEQKLTHIESDLAKENAQTTVDLQAIRKERKLVQITLSAYTTELEKLYAKQELASRAADRHLKSLGAESEEYKNAIADAKKYAKEINQLEINTGKLTGKTTSMYGATYQLTQVMRELPNFAIDARIGFMSLSNNLPMLADSFSMLSKQINESTGKAYGAMGALKIFAKSLLSANTVLIVASTLLIQYGDKLVEVFTGKVSAAEQAHRDFIKSLEEGSSSIVSEISNLAKLRAQLSLLDGKYITQTDIIKEYNDKFGDTIGRTEDFNTVVGNIINKGDGYIDVMLKMASANSILELSAKKVAEAEALRQKNISGWQAFWKGTGNRSYLKYINENGDAKQFDRDGRSRMIKNNSIYSGLSDEEIEDMLNKEQAEFDKMVELAKRAYAEMGEEGDRYVATRFMNLVKAEKMEEESAKIIKENYKNALVDIKEIADKHGIENPFEFNRDKDKGGRSGGSRQLKSLFIELDIYTQAVHELQMKMQQAEEAAGKETTMGAINGYKEREAAMKEYYKNGADLARINFVEEEARAEQKYQKELFRIDRARENNEKLYKAGKATAEEYYKAVDELDTAELNAAQNRASAVIRARDEMYAQLYELDKEYRSKLAALTADKASDAKHDIQHNNVGMNIAGGIPGVNRNTALEELKAEHEFKMEALEEEREMRRKIADEEILNYERIKAKYGKNSEEALNALKKKEEAERAYSAISNEIFLERKTYEKKTSEEIEEQIHETTTAIAGETYALIDQLVQQSFEKKLAEVDRWAEAETERVDAQVKSEVISEEQAEAQRQSIENQRAQKEKEIKNKQAKYEKAKAAFEVGMQTGVAIMQAAPTIPLMAAMAALGALQLASVLATPLPKYAKGTKNHKGGLAVLGDGGRQELIEYPNRTLGVSPDVPTIYDLPKGTKVYPDLDKVLMERALPAQVKQLQAERLVVVEENRKLLKLTEQNNRLLSVIANKKPVVIKNQRVNYNRLNQ